LHLFTVNQDISSTNDLAVALIRIAVIQDSPTSNNEIGLRQTFIFRRLIDGYPIILGGLESIAS